MVTADNPSDSGLFYSAAVIKFCNDPGGIVEGVWTLSGIEVQRSGTSIMKLISLKQIARCQPLLSPFLHVATK